MARSRPAVGLVVGCVLAALVGLTLVGATLNFVLTSNDPVAVTAGAPLTTPATVSGLSQVHTPELDRLARNGVAGMSGDGLTDALAAFYGTDGVPTLFVAAARTGKGTDEDAELDAIFDSVGETVGRPTAQTFDGLSYRCQQVRLPDVSPLIWVCGWSSKRSTGMLMHYQAQAVAEAATAADEARQSLEG
ncbi:MAG TPA: hypothetical protein VNA14_01245 [Mycobacteriales bacterium]|nr:hypothetical protein [Mycobacteriales bacterium]